MDYQILYNTIEDSVSEEQKNDLDLIVNIYLVATDVRTAYLTVDQEFTEATKKLDFIVYRLVNLSKLREPFIRKNQEFIINKKFYENNKYLFDKFEDSIYIEEYHELLGKILGYPCAGDIEKIKSNDSIVFSFNIKSGDIEDQLYTYQCQDEEIHIENAKEQIQRMKDVLKPLNIKPILKFNKHKGFLRFKKLEYFNLILNSLKNISSDEQNYINAINIYSTIFLRHSIRPMTIIFENSEVTKKIEMNPSLLDDLKKIPDIIVEYGPYYGPHNVNKFIVINKRLYSEIKPKLEKLGNQNFLERGKRDKIIGKLLGYDYVLNLEEFNKSRDPYYILRYKIVNEKDYILFVNFVPIDSSLKKATNKLEELSKILSYLDLKVKMDLEVKYRMLK